MTSSARVRFASSGIGALSVRALTLCCLAVLALLAGCREERGIGEFRRAPPAGQTPIGAPVTELRPGPPLPEPLLAENPFAGDREAIARGKELWDWFNCSGCHAGGGGAIGPPLMDGQWIYGPHDANLFASIVEGRPQGMPAYGGRIADEHVWQLIAYIRTLPPDGSASGAPEARPQDSADERGKYPYDGPQR